MRDLPSLTFAGQVSNDMGSENTTESKKHFDMETVRARLSQAKGRLYWRSLGELAETPEFMEFLRDEVPDATRTFNVHVDRRQFMRLAGASLALAGLSGCRWLPQKKIVPYVKMPEELVLGLPMFYATAVPSYAGTVIGALAKSREGRPIKLEGNPDHPSSLGSTDAITQAHLLGLYDPDRSQSVVHDSEVSTWREFFEQARGKFTAQKDSRGAGIRILTETITSPTLIAQLQRLQAQFPEAKWIQYEPAGRDNARAGARAAFGKTVNTVYHFDQARVILSLDADFLLDLPGSVRYAHDFAEGRRVRSDTRDMSRLYMLQSTPTITGTMADHRLPMRASEVEGFARLVAQQMGVAGIAGSAVTPTPDQAKVISALANDLNANRGRSVVVPGEHQPASVHALAHALNALLGNVGTTVSYSQPLEVDTGDERAALKTLTEDMAAGKVDTLIILGGNPVYTAPVDLRFGDQLPKVPFTVHLGLYEDETSAVCHWHLPEAHFLEAWGDGRAHEGTASVVQPLINPLYDGKSAIELISGLTDEPRFGYDLVRDHWLQNGLNNDEIAFNRALHDGVIANSELPAIANQLAVNAAALAASPAAAVPNGNSVEIIFRPDPHVRDGRFSNNGWLQELPKPIVRLMWDNAAYISPDTAHRLHLKNEEIIEVEVKGRKVSAPVWFQPGHPDDSITLSLGYGRTRSGQIGNEQGFNTYELITSDTPNFASGTITGTGTQGVLSTNQHVQVMEGRDIIRVGTIRQFLKDPSLAPEEEAAHGTEKQVGRNEAKNSDMGTNKNQPTLYNNNEWEWGGFGAYNWGMSIDQNVCIGCNACVVACQAENNIPIVGKDQTLVGRAMHWLRIDTYYESDPDEETTHLKNPGVYFQPMMCVHCENAPCEIVCPVAATIHSHEGLNMMIYNRCVGTKYCSNNCPYKVRRFNFLNYANHFDVPVKKMLYNPEVTVRGRGVMEKCTYCTQRISIARQKAKMENRQMHDGEVLTACQQACPTQAIIFGNITDAASKVANLKQQPHNYGVLADLNTRPRTTYLARLRNPHPDIEPEQNSKSENHVG